MAIKKLKIYIEPASLPLTHELMDYVNSINDEDTSSIIIFQRLKINIDAIQNGRTIFIDNVNEGLNLKLDSIAKFILGKPNTRFEIHTNIYRESDILFPLLKRIIPATPFENIALHLYDDGTGTMLQRLHINQIGEAALTKSLPNRVKSLKNNFITRAPIDSWQWHIIDNYIWHYFMDVRYYLIQPSQSQAESNSFIMNLQKFITPMSFRINSIGLSKTPLVWNDIFNIQESFYLKLKELATDKEAILFLTSNYIDTGFKEQYQNLLLKKIEHLKSSGLLPRDKKIVYKGHPENKKFNALICKVLGENITTLPENIPMEYFKMQGLLPNRIGGSFSSSMFSMDDNDIQFVILNGSESDSINIQLLELNHEYKCFNPESVIYLNEKNTSLFSKKRYRIFYSSASMGDIVYGTHAINSLRNIYPDDHFVFAANGIYEELITQCPSIDEFWDVNNLTVQNLHYIKEANTSSRFHAFERWEQILSNLHMTDAFIQEVTKSNVSIDTKREINITLEDKKYVDNFMAENGLTSGKIVLLHPNNGAPNRTWTQDGWAELAKLFAAHEWQVVLIGSDHNKYKYVRTMNLENCHTYDAINKFSILQTIYLMKQCQLLVACDSGPVALASYADIAISALYSIIPSDRRLPYRHGSYSWNAQGINVECQYGQCGHLIMDANFHKRTLHKKWTNPTGKTFSEWCPNKKKYSCMRKFSHLDWWEKIIHFIKSDQFILNEKK